MADDTAALLAEMAGMLARTVPVAEAPFSLRAQPMRRRPAAQPDLFDAKIVENTSVIGVDMSKE